MVTLVLLEGDQRQGRVTIFFLHYARFSGVSRFAKFIAIRHSFFKHRSSLRHYLCTCKQSLSFRIVPPNNISSKLWRAKSIILGYLSLLLSQIFVTSKLLIYDPSDVSNCYPASLAMRSFVQYPKPLQDERYPKDYCHC